MRTSNDDIRDGRVYSGFDYQLQVWVVDGYVMPCAHPDQMRDRGSCCSAFLLQGQCIYQIDGATVFSD